MNGVQDHIHAAVSIPPHITVTDWVKHVKGVSSREVNSASSNIASTFRWQRGYGVLTFGAKNLPFVVEYIAKQKEHHASGSIERYLEQIDEED